jgi:hypothetical protein
VAFADQIATQAATADSKFTASAREAHFRAASYYRKLGEKATYHLFKTDLGAGGHCRLGAEPQINAVIMDWLQGIFDKVEN